MHTREEQMQAFGRLLDVLDELRQKCPWDKKQTNESLRPNTIEETFELADAIMRGDNHDMMKELGDVLMHTLFYAMIAREQGLYDIADVLNTEADKLIFRHPHVYHHSQVGEKHPRPLPYVPEGDQAADEFSKAETSGEVLKNWEQIKLREKDGNKTVLSGVPASLPSLIKAYRIQDKARNVGFDWAKKEDVWSKVHEELGELEAELGRELPADATDAEKASLRAAQEGELGDFLFSVINAARLYHLNPENALEHTNQKFISRFGYIEQHSIRAGRPLTEMTLEEMDQLWNEAKLAPTNLPPKGRLSRLKSPLRGEVGGGQPFNIHILGCGSALPTTRHLPSMQVVDCRGKLFMVDCGEGAQLQVRRAGLSFSKLGHVFLSHLHGDHCFGLMGLISTMGLLGRTAPLHVYAPGQLEPMLTAQMQFFCRDLGYEVVFHAVDTTSPTVVYDDRSLSIETLPLEHRVPCCGYLFREKPSLPHIRRDMIDFYQIPTSQINNIKAGQGYTCADGTVVPHERLVTPADAPRSYAYCSDTRFMPSLADSLQGVTTLYHEATYAADNLAMAEKYYHSTAAQAATVAREARVGKLLLGHFSSRYVDETVLLDEARTVFPESHLTRELQVFGV